MEEQRREENQCCVIKKSDGKIEVTITPNRRVEQKDEGRQTEHRKVECIRRATTLLEQDEETHAQEDHADEIDVQHSRRPLVKGAHVVEVGPVSAHFRGIRRSLHEIVQAATYSGLLEIDLNVACGNDLFCLAAAIEADANQLVARQ